MSAIPYRCTDCGVERVKLWREWNTCADSTALLCARCACMRNPGQADLDSIGDDGARPFFLQGHQHGRIDQIGSLCPACPTPDGETFWGYTSVPAATVAWWRALPTRPAGRWPDRKGVGW